MNDQGQIPCYPDFAPLSIDQKTVMHPRLSLTADGVSEFTFSGLYLFRNRYSYRVSRSGPNGGFIISGIQPETAPDAAQTFFMTPCESPERDILKSLLKTHDYWKNISNTVLESSRLQLIYGQPGEQEFLINEDRNNFDYLYLRDKLAELKGKKYHKKKNLVNQFRNAYAHEQQPLTQELVPQAMEILDQWRQNKGEDGDYWVAREALELFGFLTLRGYIFFADGKPAAYCLGESIAKGKMFAVHFEKAIDHYKGIYQYMNQAFASALPRFFTYINREQDLGDEGLRQAKMTYRPDDFVKKYSVRSYRNSPCIT
ncbi:MAG: phosphatidylglycerol lysyltransferase domain-containing protein [Treponema sp.]|nr:phosphatidylglycerol lysyltransferase domain-containing protein [Treponema sp.]